MRVGKPMFGGVICLYLRAVLTCRTEEGYSGVLLMRERNKSISASEIKGGKI